MQAPLDLDVPAYPLGTRAELDAAVADVVRRWRPAVDGGRRPAGQDVRDRHGARRSEAIDSNTG